MINYARVQTSRPAPLHAATLLHVPTTALTDVTD